MCLDYLVFGVAVTVTLMLNVGSTQDLQVVVGLSQVLHCSGHVQGVDPIKGANEQNQRQNVKHLITLLCVVAKICHLNVSLKSNRAATAIIYR